MSEPIGDMLKKLIFAGLVIIVMITVLPVSLGFFGIVDGVGIDEVGLILLFGVLPIAVVFILFYYIMLIFTRKDKYAR